MNKLKVITVVGTRPELIRLSLIIKLFDNYFEHKLIHTGQNYDYELNEIFFKDLEIRKPDYFLNVNTSSLGTVIGDTIIKSEKILLQEKPDALLILGDTNSSMVAIIAKRLHIPIFHMEAGNRSFDFNVPEEINRRIIDHISDFNLVYTEHGRRNLLQEGLPARRIYLTGSPLYEVINHYRKIFEKSDALERIGVSKFNFFLVSFHREENVDYKENLNNIIETLETLSLSYNLPVIVSTHPRTRKRMVEYGIDCKNPLIRFNKPFGFFDYLKLQTNALCTISDSGTISEESGILGTAAVSIRNSIERPESLDSGCMILTGLKPDIVLNSLTIVINEWKNKIPEIPVEYTVSNTSYRVLNIVQGLTSLSNKWDSINSK